MCTIFIDYKLQCINSDPGINLPQALFGKLAKSHSTMQFGEITQSRIFWDCLFYFCNKFSGFFGFWDLLEKNPNPGNSGFFGRKKPNPRDFGFRNWDPKKSHPKATSATEYLSQICSEPEMRKFFSIDFHLKLQGVLV